MQHNPEEHKPWAIIKVKDPQYPQYISVIILTHQLQFPYELLKNMQLKTLNQFDVYKLILGCQCYVWYKTE